MPVIAYFLLFATGAIIGTGAYVVYPVSMYILLAGVLFIYGFFLLRKVYKVNMRGNLVLLLYVVFLLLNLLRDTGDAVASRLYLNFFLGLCTYLVVINVLSLERDSAKFRYLPLVSLIMIAAGLLLELNGVISFRADDGDDGATDVSEGLLLRPGGFLNPNMSAALSLIWLFIALESKSVKSKLLKFACIAICFFIAVITQSRASLLSLSIYGAIKLYEGGLKNLKYYVVPVAIALIAFAIFGEPELLTDLYSANVERAHGDSSSDERYQLLTSAISIFASNPFLGRGMRAMLQIFGLGTHNEVVEWLVNFGLVGFAVMLLIFFKFYYVNSIKYLCLCILPTFLFSHNFFETTAFQVALAYAFYLHRQSVQKVRPGQSMARPLPGHVPARPYRPTGLAYKSVHKA